MCKLISARTEPVLTLRLCIIAHITWEALVAHAHLRSYKQHNDTNCIVILGRSFVLDYEICSFHQQNACVSIIMVNNADSHILGCIVHALNLHCNVLYVSRLNFAVENKTSLKIFTYIRICGKQLQTRND